MTWPFLPYTLPLLLAVIFAAVPAYATWQRRSLPGAIPLLCIVAAAALWSAAHALELMSDGAQAKLFWYSFSYLGRFAVPLPMLVFILTFTGNRDWLTRRRLLWLLALPVALLILLWSNSAHALVFSSVGLDTSGPLPMLAVTPGPAYALLVLYGFGMLGAAVVLLLDMLRRCGPDQRPQVGAFLLALLAPGLVSALFVAGVHALSPADPTPLAVTFSAAALCLFYLNFRPLDILPLARDAVMEDMRDAIIVLDAQQCIADCNAEAVRFLGAAKAAVQSLPIADVLAAHAGWGDAFCTEGAHVSELAYGEGDTCRTYELTCTPIHDWRQRRVGQVAVLRDVTERRKVEETLRANEQRNRELLAAEQRQSQEMRLLEQARTALAQEMDLRSVIRTVVEAAAQMFGYTQVSAYLLEDGELALQHYVGYTSVFWRIPLNKGVNGRVGRTGVPVLLPDVRTAPDYMEAHNGVISEVCVPLFDRGQVAGTFNVESSNGVVLGEADLRLMLALSEHVNFAITRARLYAQVRDSEERFRRLTEAAFEGVLIHDNSIVLDANPEFARMFGYSPAELPGMSVMAFIAPESIPPMIARGLDTPEPFEGLALHKNGTKFPVEARGRPMLAGGRAMRVTSVRDISARKRAEEALRESEARYRQRATEMTALYETMSAITTQRDLPVLLRTIVERATQLLGNTSGGLYLCDPLRREVRCVVSFNTLYDYAGVTMRYGEGAAGIVAETGKPLNIEDYGAWAQRAAVFEKDTPFKAVLNVPMIWQGQVSGVLTVNAPDRQFSQADVELLTLFADQATVAVENARLLEEVQRLAVTDDLTGIYNRRQLFELGARELLRAQRFAHPLSVLMIDIDRFKTVNDSYGHAAGDQVLREVAQHCARFIREFDTLARYGGEEFAILLPETDAGGARRLGERLRESIAAKEIPAGGAVVHVTISLGGAMSSGDAQTFEQLIDLADHALYAAKQAGRNRVEVSAVLQ